LGGGDFYFIKKSNPTFSLPFLFIKYSKTTYQKHHIDVNIQNLKKKWGIFSIEFVYGSLSDSKSRNTPQNCSNELAMDRKW
jgi:hypothetical protein